MVVGYHHFRKPPHIEPVIKALNICTPLKNLQLEPPKSQSHGWALVQMEVPFQKGEKLRVSQSLGFSGVSYIHTRKLTAGTQEIGGVQMCFQVPRSFSGVCFLLHENLFEKMVVLLMEEILHHLTSMKPCKKWDVVRWIAEPSVGRWNFLLRCANRNPGGYSSIAHSSSLFKSPNSRGSLNEFGAKTVELRRAQWLQKYLDSLKLTARPGK